VWCRFGVLLVNSAEIKEDLFSEGIGLLVFTGPGVIVWAGFGSGWQNCGHQRVNNNGQKPSFYPDRNFFSKQNYNCKKIKKNILIVKKYVIRTCVFKNIFLLPSNFAL
jgi:hypothetical protein